MFVDVVAAAVDVVAAAVATVIVVDSDTPS